MNRSRKPTHALLLALALAAGGCGTVGAFPTANEPEITRRRPDGVAIDPTSSPPAPRDRAEASDGLVTLRTPLGTDRAIVTVDELFRKVVLEDGEGIEAIFTRDAQVGAATPSGGSGPGARAIDWWQQRFRRLDYSKLAGETLFREADLEIFRGGDAPEALPNPAIRLEALADDDVVVRVPILTARLGAERFFGDELLLWLRRDGDRYRIYRMLEDFQLN